MGTHKVLVERHIGQETGDQYATETHTFETKREFDKFVAERDPRLFDRDETGYFAIVEREVRPGEFQAGKVYEYDAVMVWRDCNFASGAIAWAGDTYQVLDFDEFDGYRVKVPATAEEPEREDRILAKYTERQRRHSSPRPADDPLGGLVRL